MTGIRDQESEGRAGRAYIAYIKTEHIMPETQPLTEQNTERALSSDS
jgi:hypothetical protein